MRLLSVVGTRPQFIKEALLHQAMAAHNRNHKNRKITEILVHTGQHYDYRMSQIFFDQFTLPPPHYNLEVRESTHGRMVGAMLPQIEQVLKNEAPDWVVVFGDCNTTLAGALAAAKLGIPIAHVEAGVRSYNRCMPEEINRLLTDRISTLLFCPTEKAQENLQKEGISAGVIRTGDIMLDAFSIHKDLALKRSLALEEMGLSSGNYCLATVHRQENIKNNENLRQIFSAFSAFANRKCPVVIPMHPHTRQVLERLKNGYPENKYVYLISPRNYFDNLALICHARVVLTDSGGMQKEAFFAQVPCLTLRRETEWPETAVYGWNRLVGADSDAIGRALHEAAKPLSAPALVTFGGGESRFKMIANLVG